MSGAARAACPAGVAAGARRGTRGGADVWVLAGATSPTTCHRVPRAARRFGSTTVGRPAAARDSAHVSLVAPSDAAMPRIAFAAVGQVPGWAGAADAGVC